MKSNLLQSHIAALKQREQQEGPKDHLLFLGSAEDKSYLAHLKSYVGTYHTYIRLEPPSTIAEIELYCKQRKINKVISTSIPLLKKLLGGWDKRAAPSLADYAGSYFSRNGIEYVFIQPLKQLITVPYGKFMASRNVSKLLKPEQWFNPIPFSWDVYDPSKHDTFLATSFSTADLISIDIETVKENAQIKCVAFSAFWLSEFRSYTVVVPIDSEYNLAICRKLCSLAPPKVFQNGKYDISYLSRYSSPVTNYLYDTAHFFHSWYSELPKDLGFLNAFFIREAVYWKDLADTQDLYEYYKYNALDAWGTGNCFLAMIAEAPDWAVDNYIFEFPLVFPCHLAEMTGIKRDMNALETARKEQQQIIAEKEKELDTILDIKGFNVNSPNQMRQLLCILGCSDLKSADEKHLMKAAFRHPLNTRIVDLILDIRGARKLVSTYLSPGKEFNGRILYSLNPHGTDTSRLASKSHHFWCGLNIQNIPRGPAVKQTLVADPGFKLYEVDLEQAESRDTAYISGDEKLIDSVEYSPDFHCKNASLFFGIPFEELYDVVTHKKLNVPIRNLAKNVNHGANYNMGEDTLINTMGMKKVYEAAALLKLPKSWSLKEIAAFLLGTFHNTYDQLRGLYYPEVIKEVLTTSRLEHHLIGEKGLVRYCFSDPSKSKPALNAYIAHPPQSLNARTLNKAWLRVFIEIAMNPEHSSNFKQCAQIHDSILFQVREGHEYLVPMVKDMMEIPVTIRGYDGKVRTFTVPADPSKGGDSWGSIK